MAVDMKGGMFTSLRGDWETPQDLFDQLDATFHFTLDACADDTNYKVAKYFDEAMDALSRPWGTVESPEVVWMNPPYGQEIGKWLKKAFDEVEAGRVSKAVCLVPSRTDTKWWHDYCMKGDIYFVKGRLKFGRAKTAAPFPSAIVVFGGRLPTDLGMRHRLHMEGE